MKKIKVLALWHAAVVSPYRKRYTLMARDPQFEITMMLPQKWREGELRIPYEYNENIDENLKIITAPVYAQDNLRRYYFKEKYWNTIKELKPDILDIFEEPFSYSFFQSVLYKKLISRKSRIIFHSAHNTDDYLGYNFEIIKKIGLGNSSCGICRNKESIMYFKKNNFKKPLFHIGNSIDTNNFYKKENNSLKKKLGLANTVVGYIGRILQAKGIECLIDAAAMITDQKLDLLIIGDGNYKSEIIHKAEKIKTLHNVIFIDHIRHEEVNDYLNVLDICILPSLTTPTWKESFGRILIEAMSVEIPVIGSDSGNIPETVDGCGLIFKENNAIELKNQILKLINSPFLKKSLIKKGLAHSQKYSLQSIAEKHKNVYKEIYN